MRRMSTLRSRLLAVAAIAGLGATTLSACQVYPGDYRVYRVTSLAPTVGIDCENQPDLRDTSTFFGVATIAMFASDSDSYFLELGADVLTGTRDGGVYSYEGVSVNVDDLGMVATTTTTRTLDVQVTLKNKEIVGTATEVNTVTCTGDCMGFTNTSCTLTTNFFGSEVNGAELEHPI